jgi:hypothetical protein
MRARALIVAGSALIGAGLFVLSPAVWLIVDQLFQQILGAPLIGIVIGGGGIIIPMVLTALGTAGIIGGAWMIANGNRRLREPVKPRVSVKTPDNVARPEHKTTSGE